MLRRWRLGTGLVFFLGAIFAMAGVVTFALGPGSVAQADAPPFKVTLCHATAADNNPYVSITVSFNAVARARGANGHGDHTGPIWVAGDKAAHIKWGDIIPAYYYPSGVANGSTFHYLGMNWTTAGQAIWNNDCRIPTSRSTPTEKKAVAVIKSPGPTSTTTSTAVFDAATNAALIDGNLTAGGSAYDTSTVTTGAKGTVRYLFWTNGDCGVREDGAGTRAGTALALSSHSSAEGPLTAGSYSFEAVYTSYNAALFTGSTSACEPFTVVAGGVGGSTASPSPTATPTGGVLAATGTGGVLAATGGNTPAQGLALLLIAFGLLAMVGGALAWRRRRI